MRPAEDRSVHGPHHGYVAQHHVQTGYGLGIGEHASLKRDRVDLPLGVKSACVSALGIGRDIESHRTVQHHAQLAHDFIGAVIGGGLAQ